MGHPISRRALCGSLLALPVLASCTFPEKGEGSVAPGLVGFWRCIGGSDDPNLRGAELILQSEGSSDWRSKKNASGLPNTFGGKWTYSSATAQLRLVEGPVVMAWDKLREIRANVRRTTGPDRLVLTITYVTGRTLAQPITLTFEKVA